MSQGISLHVGLNHVDSSKYDGWMGRLRTCEADAYAMQDICKYSGCTTKTLLTKQASTPAVLTAIDKAASQLHSNDYFILTFSCYGGLVNYGGGLTDTLALYDREILSEELYAEWAKFKRGVNILMVVDASHCGTIGSTSIGITVANMVKKSVPLKLQNKLHSKNEFQRKLMPKKLVPQAGVIILSACQDYQYAYESDVNGLFTEKLLGWWDVRQWRGDYPFFFRQIVRSMPNEQTPNYLEVGHVSWDFRLNRPFYIRKVDAFSDQTPPK